MAERSYSIPVPGRPDWRLKLVLSGGEAVGPGLHASLELVDPADLSRSSRWVSALWPGPGFPWVPGLAAADGEWAETGSASAETLEGALAALLPLVGEGRDAAALAAAAASVLPDPAAFVLAREVVSS